MSAFYKMTELEKEFQKFEEDIENNEKDSKNQDYIKKRTASLMKYVFDEINKLMYYNNQKINDLENKLNSVKSVVEGIVRDIYLEDSEGELEEDFQEEIQDTVNCPYCGSEIPIDYDESVKELECLECHNIIELDWTGETEEKEKGCSGHCSSCGGCQTDDSNEEN